jgi:hypothetical protein
MVRRRWYVGATPTRIRGYSLTMIKKFLTDNAHGRPLTIADLIRRTNAERGRADDERTAEILQSAFGAQPLTDISGNPISETARLILAAGAKRRAEIQTPVFADDKHGKFARAVVNAARKAKNQEPI